MLKWVEPYITYGEPNLKTVRTLIYKRGFAKINKQRLPLSDNSVIQKEGEKTVDQDRQISTPQATTGSGSRARVGCEEAEDRTGAEGKTRCPITQACKGAKDKPKDHFQEGTKVRQRVR
jgi:hypothetical protein